VGCDVFHTLGWWAGRVVRKITGKDSNGATFTDTYAEGSEITVTTSSGGTTKFKCVNGSWVLATVVVSHALLDRMIG
jgi:hypothetical protein